MKKYDVKIRSVKENIITVSADCKKDAIDKVNELLMCTNLKDLEIQGLTKYFILLKVETDSIFFKKRHHKK